MRNPLQLPHARRPPTAVNLLHGLCIVQDLLVVDCAGLEDHHAVHRGRFYPHDRVAGRAVMVRDTFAGVAGTSVGAVGAGFLVELCFVWLGRGY